MYKDKIIELFTANKPYILIFLIFLIFFIYILNFAIRYVVVKRLKKEKGLRFYYKFLGNIYWLKEEILNKRYLELRYLNPVQAKENANVEILLKKNDENDGGEISIYMKNYKIILKKLKLNNNQFKEVLENFPHTMVDIEEEIEEEKKSFE